MTNEVADVLNSDVVNKAYDDIGSPLLKELGDWGGNIVRAARLALFPIDMMAYGHNRLEIFLQKSLDKVKVNDLVEPQLSIAGPIIEGIKYQEEDSILYDMFSNLLTSSIDKDKVSNAHPAFANIIKQLSPDEAVIVFYLSKQSFILRQQLDLDMEKNQFNKGRILINEFPLNQLISEDNFFLYMNHLNSLNLAGTWQVGNQEPIYTNGSQTGVYINKIMSLSEFGELFAKACIPENIDNFTDIKNS